MAGFGLVIFEYINFEVATILSGTIGSVELNVMSISLQVLIISYTVDLFFYLIYLRETFHEDFFLIYNDENGFVTDVI
jgi:hypothetical protein